MQRQKQQLVSSSTWPQNPRQRRRRRRRRAVLRRHRIVRRCRRLPSRRSQRPATGDRRRYPDRDRRSRHGLCQLPLLRPRQRRQTRHRRLHRSEHAHGYPRSTSRHRRHSGYLWTTLPVRIRDRRRGRSEQPASDIRTSVDVRQQAGDLLSFAVLRLRHVRDFASSADIQKPSAGRRSVRVGVPEGGQKL